MAVADSPLDIDFFSLHLMIKIINYTSNIILVFPYLKVKYFTQGGKISYRILQ